MVKIKHFSLNINCEMHLKIEFAIKISIFNTWSAAAILLHHYNTYSRKRIEMCWSPVLHELSQDKEGT
jgi:hypothetical protein